LAWRVLGHFLMEVPIIINNQYLYFTQLKWLVKLM
jgi:hypothetical protein